MAEIAQSKPEFTERLKGAVIGGAVGAILAEALVGGAWTAVGLAVGAVIGGSRK